MRTGYSLHGADLRQRLKEIKERYVDRGSCVVINRGRQYGKTTTLRALAEYPENDYAVISLDFQKISDANFRDEYTFSEVFVDQLAEIYAYDSNLHENMSRETIISRRRQGMRAVPMLSWIISVNSILLR